MKLVVLDSKKLAPEDLAMLQAMYSRSPDSVTNHLKTMKKLGSANFMEKYYLGYGHASIGDCGDAVLFLEGVSILCAKAWQDWPLYNGQECSTRYIDFHTTGIFGPTEWTEEKSLFSLWMEIYEEVYNAVVAKEMQGLDVETITAVQKNAIHARACDIARGFLPLGVKTNLSVKMSLRQFQDKIAQLFVHPLDEVASSADNAIVLLNKSYPNSFKIDDYPNRVSYYGDIYDTLHYYDYKPVYPYSDLFSLNILENFDWDIFREIDKKVWNRRPAKTSLPRLVGECGTFTVEGAIDYGSFRDLQRHRPGICRLPLVKGDLFIHPWYIDNVPTSVKKSVMEKLSQANKLLSILVSKNQISIHDKQYYYPLGQVVNFRLTYDLPELVYVAELRSTQHVHATLREVAIQMGTFIKQKMPRGFKLYIDKENRNKINWKRGEQTFRSALENTVK